MKHTYPSKWAFLTWLTISAISSLTLEQPGKVHLKSCLVLFLRGSSQSPPISLSIPSSLEDGVGLKLFAWSSPGDDTAPRLPTTLWFALSHEDAPDELELHDDEIISTTNKQYIIIIIIAWPFINNSKSDSIAVLSWHSLSLSHFTHSISWWLLLQSTHTASQSRIQFAKRTGADHRKCTNELSSQKLNNTLSLYILPSVSHNTIVTIFRSIILYENTVKPQKLLWWISHTHLYGYFILDRQNPSTFSFPHDFRVEEVHNFHLRFTIS